ncbi:MAG: tetratricopeptide repeat protein [Candidatus Marinimicrobia bacterium]|nr:tetratricopeptide repeat protein [Candidatus Neomarinimicrobiota bacterium]
MRTRHLAVLYTLLFMVSFSYAVDYERIMLSGNQYYEQGDFDQAIEAYETILKSDGATAALYYNLGNAYFNQKDYGKAILYFEKARILSPRDADILHNLKFSKLFLKDRFDLPEPMPLVAWFDEIRQSLALAELQFWETTWFILLILGIAYFRLFGVERGNRSMLLPVVLVGILFVLTSGWLWNRAVSLDDQHAILLVKEARIASAPLVSSSTLFVIHEGTSAEILSATDSWYEIRLADGKTGWVVHEAVGVY